MYLFRNILPALIACACCAASSTPSVWSDPTVLPLSGTGNAALDLQAHPQTRWSNAVGATTNAARFNALTTASNGQKAYVVPCGRWELTESLLIPARMGYLLTGAGGNSKDYADLTAARGPVSILVWRGNATDGMLKVGSLGSRIENLHFQGSPVANASNEDDGQTRAAIGIHFLPSNQNGSNGTLNTSKARLDHLSFYRVLTGILVGRDLADVGAWNFAGERDPHADSISAGDLNFYYPYAGPYNNVGTAVHIRTSQAVCTSIQAIYSHGNPEQTLYVERGGGAHVGLISQSGGTDGTTIAVRVGKLDIHDPFLRVDAVKIDPAGTKNRLLVMDWSIMSLPVIEINGAHIPRENVASSVHGNEPCIDLRAGVITLRNIWMLKKHAIRIRARRDSADSWQACFVNLENCIIDSDVNAIQELIVPAGANSQDSNGPYRVTWRNCVRWQQTAGNNLRIGQPVEDGFILQSDNVNGFSFVRKR